MSYQNLKEFYLSKAEIENALAEYNADRPNEERLFYITYYEEWKNRTIYIPCEEAYFHFWRNEQRKERIYEIREGRCKVPSKKYGVKQCIADCKHCPYKQNPDNPEEEVTDYHWTGNTLSLDQPVGYQDDGDPIYLDVADDSESVLERLISEEIAAERKKLLHELLFGLSETDRTIISLYYSYSKSDSEISKVVNIPRATVQRRRTKAFDYLKDEIKKYAK